MKRGIIEVVISLTKMPMTTNDTSYKKSIKQSATIGKYLASYSSLFTKPSYETFKRLIIAFLKFQETSLTNTSLEVKKCVSTLSYFFNEARWSFEKLNQKRIKIVETNKLTRIEKEDIACFDESSVAKKGDSFEFIGDVYDTTEEEIKNGYSFLTVGIVSLKRKLRWIHESILYSNKNPHFKGKFVYVLRLLKRLFEKTKIMLVIFDRGFKNMYVLSFVLAKKRDFIIRAEEDMILYDEKNNKKKKPIKFGKINQAKGSTRFKVKDFGNIKVSIAKGIVKAWQSQIRRPLTVLRIKRSGFLNPMFLVTSLPVKTPEEALKIYFLYLNRWKIEQIYQEIKELGLEKFRLRKMKAILKYITILVLIHTILTLKLHWLKMNFLLAEFVQYVLKKYRKINDLLLVGLKRFLEMVLKKQIDLNSNFALFLEENYGSPP